MTVSVLSIIYHFLDSTKIYIILHFVHFISLHFPLSLVLLYSPGTFFNCECGSPWDVVHLWRSQHNSGFTLSFHQEFLGINLKSLRLHSTSFSCWAVHRSIFLSWKAVDTMIGTFPSRPCLILITLQTPDSQMEISSVWTLSECIYKLCLWFSLNKIQTRMRGEVCAWYYHPNHAIILTSFVSFDWETSPPMTMTSNAASLRATELSLVNATE